MNSRGCAGAGGNLRREDSPLLLKAYVACDILVAGTVLLSPPGMAPLGRIFSIFKGGASASLKHQPARIILQAGTLIYLRRIREQMEKGSLLSQTGTA